MGLVRTLLAVLLLVVAASTAMAANRVIIILDASGSMWAKIDGKPKLQIARESLRTVLKTVPADDEIGFMAYGHREKGSCQDIELIVPPAAGTADAIARAADQLKFLGKTPLSDAVKQAAEALKYTEDKATVVLITDGLETCGGDPCALGKELKEAGVDFTAHVVGFGLTAEEGRKVACLAENTGGKYIQAGNEQALQDALTTVVAAPAPEPEKPAANFLPEAIMAEGGDGVSDGVAWVVYRANADGSRGDNLETNYGDWKGNLEPGSYVVTARLGEAETEQPVTIEAGQVYKPTFVLNAGILVLHPKAKESGEIEGSARIDFTYPGGSTTTYGDTRIVVPAGAETVKTTIGNGSLEETIQLAAGQTIEKDVVVGVGQVLVDAYYTDGGDKIDGSGVVVEIVKARKKIDGTRDSVETRYGTGNVFALPPGDYAAVASVQDARAEKPFSVKVGDELHVDVVLNAGVLAVTAEGAKSIEIVQAKKDIAGNRKSLSTGYDATYQTTLNAGDYVAIAYRGDDNKATEQPVTIKAGERTEIAIP